MYTEDYYLSKQLDDDIIKRLQETAKTLQDTITTNPKKSLENAVKDYDLKKDLCMPNLLLKEYSVKFDE